MPNGGFIAFNSNLHTVNSLKSKRWRGIANRKKFSYDVESLGWNYYLNEISAGIGLVQLKRLTKLNKRRLEIAKKYNKFLNLEKKCLTLKIAVIIFIGFELRTEINS